MDIISSMCVNIPEMLFVRVARSSFVADYARHEGHTIAWQSGRQWGIREVDFSPAQSEVVLYLVYSCYILGLYFKVRLCKCS